MNIAGIKSHFTNWREWEFNPIVIKELRQAVRSWAVTGMLMLFLTVLFITSLVFLVGQSVRVNEDVQLGSSMFQAFVIILAGASMMFIPLYIGIRVAAERGESNHDLLYVSTLSPGRIIRGKLYCGAYMALLFFSACMPFMAFTNLLRGVDLPSVFFILLFLFLVVCAANQIAIFLACLPLSRPFKILLALAGLFFSFWLIGGLIVGAIGMMRLGLGSMMANRNFWMTALTVLVAGLIVTGLFYVLSVALISPPSANRARLPRLYITVIWLLGGLLNFAWVIQVKEPTAIMAWTLATFFILIFALLVVVSNADELGPRVRRDIPANRLKRRLVFPFFNGAASGLLWVSSLAAITFILTQLVLTFGDTWYPTHVGMSGANREDFTLCTSTTIFYALAYALTARFIHRQFFPKRPPQIAGLLTILLVGLVAIGPGIVLFFLNQLSWKSIDGLQLGNMFNIFSIHEPSQRWSHFYVAGGWLALMLVINAGWFLKQWRNFQPPPGSCSKD
jgi:hypothetical protein